MASPTAANEATASRGGWGAAVVAAAFVPSLVGYYARLWSLPHYQFFPLALVGAGLLARRASAEPFAPSVVRRDAWIALVTGGLLALTTSIVLSSPWLACVAALITTAAWVYGRGGTANVVRFLPAGLMSLVTLRPPLNLDLALIAELQHVTARAAGAALDVLGVPHVLAGNVIELPGRRLFVEEACSGVNSLFSTLACTLFYLLWTRRHGFVWTVLLGSVPFWVTAANAARITTVAVLRYRWNVAADEGMLHDALGFLVFAGVLLCVFGTERLLTFYSAVLPPEDFLPDKTKPPASVEAPDSKRVASIGPKAWIVPAAFAGVVIVLQIPSAAREARDLTQLLHGAPIDELGADFLPPSHGAWKRSGYEHLRRDRGSPLGEHSQIWLYGGPASRVVAQLDYPFLGWHELGECYTAQGWSIAERRVVEARDGRPEYVEIDLRHAQAGRYGRLRFALLSRDGRPIPIRRHGEWDELRDRVVAKLRDVSSWTTADGDDAGPTYQVQVFAESYAPPTSADDKAVGALFDVALGSVRRSLTND